MSIDLPVTQPPPSLPAAPAPASPHPPGWNVAVLEDLAARLDGFRAAMLALEREVLARYPRIHPAYRASARNLAHYLALRRHDARETQARLRRLGLSSLGRIEGQVLANVDAVRRVLAGLLGRPFVEPAEGEHPIGIDGATAWIDGHAAALFGPRPHDRRVHLMVTLPSEAAQDERLVGDLVRAGMNVARINCAHDGPPAWERMIAHVRAAATAGGRSCRVLMDLAGPKLRTGPVAPGPCVVHWAPPRDVRGQILAPATVLLTGLPPPARPEVPVDAVLHVPAEWVAERLEGDVVEFTDLRGRGRRLTVASISPAGALATSEESAWLEPGTRLAARRRGERGLGPDVPLGPVAPTETQILLRPGDGLVLTRAMTPGRPAQRDAAGRLLAPATIPCTLPEVFARVKVGESVFLDDGKIGGRVRAVTPDAITVEITAAKPTGTRLGADKGINLPDTLLALPGLTAKDQADLGFVVEHADAVGLSFIDDPRDVHDLWDVLRRHAGRPVGVVLKVETRRGFERLPELLLAAMEGYPVGVMIARGDLAVECGFERLAEAQEEILWMCEAAHVPTIWATQVLETLAKKGQATRAEVTDAAMSERAECVMLNKGPHVVTALRTLDDILRRMQEHQSKKQTLLRSLRISHL